MSRADSLLLSNAAFVLQADPEELRKKVLRGDVCAHKARVKGRDRLFLDQKTLVILAWSRELAEDIKPSLLRKLDDEIRHYQNVPSHISVGHFTAELSDARRGIEKRLKALEALNKQVEKDKHGNAVLKGTGVEVHRIAALVAGGASVDSVLEDYPTLTADQVAFSQAYAAAHPKSGRPFPKITAKAAIQAADLGALDLDD